MNKPKKRRKPKAGKAGCLVAGVAATSLAVGCSSDKDKWTNSPGTNGHINLTAVRKTFQKYPHPEEFEKRVNEIYEGDNVVIFHSKKVSGGFEYTAYEDLDGNKEISKADDRLFILTVANRTATLKGVGVTSYYSEAWPYDPEEHRKVETRYVRSHYYPYSYYGWYGGGYWGGGRNYYRTSPSQYQSLNSHRSSYRQTSAFTDQVKRNTQAEQRASKHYGKGFRKSATKVSTNRKSYISKGRSSGAYKSSGGKSGWSVRSSSGTKGSFSSARSSGSRGFGGFRGSSGFGI